MRGATVASDLRVVDELISIHAPREGCDGSRPVRALHADISIHAPREGCDELEDIAEFDGDEFQSTHPVRGATTMPSPPPMRRRFQSTHPVRGATLVQARTRNFNKISIHAPREGCDVPSCLAIAAPFLFQSTHPVRGATGARHLAFDGFLISIHAPREGCD